MRKLLRFKELWVIILLLLSDIGLKYYTFKNIAKMTWADTSYPFGGIGIFQNFLNGISFSLNHVENIGAAWGIFSSYSDYLFLARIFIVLGLTIYVLFFNSYAFRKIPLFLIITGATGNIIDFFLYGHVIDMFHFNFWGYTFPIFNLADSMIFIGVCLLFFLSKKKLPSTANS